MPNQRCKSKVKLNSYFLASEKEALYLRARRLGYKTTTAYLRAIAQSELRVLYQLAESSKFNSTKTDE